MSKLERLLNLIAALVATETPLTADQIRARIAGAYSDSNSSFHRTFERDKLDLRSMGVPVELQLIPTTQPPTEGYIIDAEAYAGSDPQLEPDELAALHLAANLVPVAGGSGQDALLRLGGLVHPEATAPVAEIPTDENLAPLFQAASERRTVRFEYNNVDREVDPWLLTFARGHWYLAGYDHHRASERNYRVDRIGGGVDAGEPGAFAAGAAPTRRPDAAGWELGDGEPIAARLLVGADRALWATHQLGIDAIIDDHGDDGVEFEVTVRNPAAFRGFVLSFLDHAEILSPAELRDDMIQWLEALV